MNLINQLISKPGRRYLLLGLLIILIIFGAQINGPSSSEVRKTTLEIGFKDTTYRLPNKVNARTGDKYRLSYRVRALANSDLDPRESEGGSLQATAKPAPTVVKMYAIGPARKELIDTLSIPSGRDYIFHEKIFEASFEVADLLIERETNIQLTGVNIEGLVVTRLDVSAQALLTTLRPTITSTPKLALDNVMQLKGKDRLYSFIGRSDLIAQEFAPKNPYISGVDLALNFHRTGGKEPYQLSLARVISQKGNKISYQTVASVNFDVQDQMSVLDGRAIYHLPLFAQAKVGEPYLLLISGQNVRTNVLHSLDIIGSRNTHSYPDGKAIQINSSGSFKEIGDLYFRIYGAEFPSQEGGRYLYGQIIEDRGSDLQLTYQSNHQPSDLLDVDSMENDPRSHGASIFFDPEMRQVVGAAAEGNSFTYKLVSPSPLTSFYLSAGLINPTAGQTVVSYSPNGKDWTDLPLDARGTVINQSLEISPTTTLFIKVSYQGEPSKDGKFGLQDLILQAKAKK